CYPTEMETKVELKTCACKGCRRCIVCENHFDQNQLKHSGNEKQKVQYNLYKFLFTIQTINCVCYQGHHLVGFDFPGVSVFQDFISAPEERELIRINSNRWKDSQSGRRKQDYGPKVNFKKKKVKLSSFTGLPKYIDFIVERIRSLEGLDNFATVEQCNLEYDPVRGASIDPHYDDAWLWGERLLSLNLLSDSWFTMTTDDSAKIELTNLKPEIVDIDLTSFKTLDIDSGEFGLNEFEVKVPLCRRSLVMLSGDARYKWKHSIQRKDITSKRLCCTFRELSPEFSSGGTQEHIGRSLL
uniref:Fe2OG dioxygenase domain-containing protein n=1 Tax=Ciona savignyi TaxID=51511 RepID=H2YZF4_CIOSA